MASGQETDAIFCKQTLSQYSILSVNVINLKGIHIIKHIYRIYHKELETQDGIDMYEVQVKSILSPQNGMNLYRGCSNGCIYCDARSACYQMQHAFEDIEVKKNAAELLEKSLRAKRKRCMIGTGAMSDPYLHLEKELLHTRRCLELIDEYGFGLAIQTKSDLILRDLDLLKSIHKKAKCVVQMTLTTYDEIVRGILNYCATTGVYGILHFGIGVTLREGDRQYFYKKLDEHFPGMKEKYIKTFGNAYEVPSPNQGLLMKILKEECKKHNIVSSSKEVFEYMHEFEDPQAGRQISLFDEKV